MTLGLKNMQVKIRADQEIDCHSLLRFMAGKYMVPFEVSLVVLNRWSWLLYNMV